MNIESFAEKSSLDFLTSLQAKHSLIDELISLGVNIIDEPANENALAGKKICITGTLSQKRSTLVEKIRNAGGIIVSSVSKGTDFLLTNDKNSSSTKFLKAKELKIPLITEEELMSFIQE